MPSWWLVQKEPMWLSKMNNEEKGLEAMVTIEYVLEPFLDFFFEPYGWHDTLATLDVCTNVHATKNYHEEGYDIMSTYMMCIVLVLENEETNIIQCNEERVLEGLGTKWSRVNVITSKTISQVVLLMAMRMKITSIKDKDTNSN